MEAYFSGPLILEDNGDETFIVRKEFAYYLGYFDSSWRIVVPEGFRTDLTSIPRLLTVVFPRYGKYTQCAVLHDALYQLVRKGELPKRLADFLFLDSMRHLKVPWYKRYTMYFAVRIFGGLVL